MTIRDLERITSPALGVLAFVACVAMPLVPGVRLWILAAICLMTAAALGLVAHAATIVRPDKAGPVLFFVIAAFFWIAMAAFLTWREIGA